MGKWWLLAGLGLASVANGGEPGQFDGKVVVEWLDDNPFVFSMRLVRDFSFTQAKGKVWTVPAGQMLDGRGIPPLFLERFGQPFDGGFRKSAVVYDHATRVMTETWRDAQRMFLEASVAEGVPASEAKAMYLVLIAQGSRWEVAGSRCYGSCHGKTVPLEWRPLIDETRLGELLNLVRATDPPAEDLERMAQPAILDRGPHVFPPNPCAVFSGSTLVKWKC